MVDKMSITRKELYYQFGPILLEAIVLLIKDEINILRVAAGKPERTSEQVMDGIASKLSALTKYNWMNK